MPDPRNVCTVKAAGRIYKAWKSITITHTLPDMVPIFQMSCSEGGKLGGDNDSRRLVPQTPVTIDLGGQLVLTGAIEVRLASYDAGSHDVMIGGGPKPPSWYSRPCRSNPATSTATRWSRPRVARFSRTARRSASSMRRRSSRSRSPTSP